MSLAAVVRAISARVFRQHSRPISTTCSLRGLEEFFDSPSKEGEAVSVGMFSRSAPHNKPDWVVTAPSAFPRERKTFSKLFVTDLIVQGEPGRLLTCV
jgi:hypothetical protein